MTNIPEGNQDFKTFEKTIFDIMCLIACELMRQYLEWRDRGIMALRDKKEYSIIDSRETTVKTVMGEVRFSRRYYKKRSGGYVFLLDEAMGIFCGCGQASENLVEQIVVECTDKSFRKAASDINSFTGQSISAMGAWGIFQKFGETIEQQVARLKELNDSGSTGHVGKVSSAVIFDEYDDVWISRQKEKRQKRSAATEAPGKPEEDSGKKLEEDSGKNPEEATGKKPEKDSGKKPEEGFGKKPEEDSGKKPEKDSGKNPEESSGKKPEEASGKKPKKKLGKKPLHVGIAYTGWEQAKDGSYGTLDKIAYASFGPVAGFTSSFEALLRQQYDMDGVERRVTNGDGEAWIRTTAENNDSILQLDPYHRSKAIIKAVCDKSDRKLLFKAIKKKDVERTLSLICEMALDAQDEPTLKKLVELYGYFRNNKDIFLTWQERGIELPKPPEGVAYREMGVQESNNYSLITNRMKHRRGSWSEQGGDRMAQVLCFRNTVGLDAMLGTLPEPPPVEAWSEPLSAAKAPQYDGKHYGADWLHAEMPFEQAFRTNGREVIRNMVRMQPLSQLPFVYSPGVDKTTITNS